MIVLLRRRHVAAVALLLGLLTAAALLLPTRTQTRAALARNGWQTIVLDAGHGGEDGGAVSADGVAESGLNLAITRQLREVLLFLGRDTLLTRSGEESICSPEAQTLREKKRSDLENRAALVAQQPDPLLISLHQNSLPGSPGVHGAQVFFNTVEPGSALAQSVQEALNRSVNRGNEKSARAIDSSIYLMKTVRCPAILVECGFLSHAEEAQLLQQPDYQRKLALSIAAGLLQYDTKGAST